MLHSPIYDITPGPGVVFEFAAPAASFSHGHRLASSRALSSVVLALVALAAAAPAAAPPLALPARRIEEALGEVVPVLRRGEGFRLRPDAALRSDFVARVVVFVVVVVFAGDVAVLVELLFLRGHGLQGHVVAVGVHAVFAAEDLVGFVGAAAAVAVQGRGRAARRAEVLPGLLVRVAVRDAR